MESDLKTLSDLVDTKLPLTEGIRRRISDPILSTFSVTFLIWNYEIFIFTFSDMLADDKIARIAGVLHRSSAFLYPLIVTIFILFCLPLLTVLYDKIEEGRVRLQNSKIKADGKLIPYQHELQMITNKLSEEIKRTDEANSKLSDKDQEIGALTSKLTESNLKLSKYEAVQISSDDTVNKAIAFLRRNKIESDFKSIAAKSTISRVYISGISSELIVKLISQNLFIKGTTTAGPYVELSDLGRKVHQFLLEA